MSSHYLVPADGSFKANDGRVKYTATPLIYSYTEPMESGLIGMRPYPDVTDVCLVIRETTLTAPYMKKGRLLIGCPKHETGAIGDRISEGGIVAAYGKHWILLQMPGQDSSSIKTSKN